MKAALLLVATLLIAPVTFAQDVSFTSPKPFKLIKTSQDVTRFSGSAVLTGKFTAILETPGEDAPRYIRVLFLPDAPSSAKLPHDKARGRVNQLWLRNTERSLSLLLPRNKLKSLRSGRVMQVTGTAEIVVNSYVTGVDCDRRGYSAILLSVAGPPAHVAVSNSERPPTGC